MNIRSFIITTGLLCSAIVCYVIYRPHAYRLYVVVRPVEEVRLPVLVYLNGREIGQVEKVRPMKEDSTFLLMLTIAAGEKIPGGSIGTYRKVVSGTGHLDIRHGPVTGDGKGAYFMQPLDTLLAGFERGPFYEIKMADQQ